MRVSPSKNMQSILLPKFKLLRHEGGTGPEMITCFLVSHSTNHRYHRWPPHSQHGQDGLVEQPGEPNYRLPQSRAVGVQSD